MSIYAAADLIVSLYPLSSILGIGVGLLYYKKLVPLFRSLIYYLFITTSCAYLSVIIGENSGNNLIFFPLFSLLELSFFAFMFARYMTTGIFSKFVLGIGAIACSYILYELLSIDFSDVKNFQSYARPVNAFAIVVMSMSFFFEKLSAGTNFNDQRLYLNTGILLFFSLNLVFQLPLNFLINQSSNLKFYFWFGNTILTILFYLFITFTIWKNGRTQKH